MRSSRSGELRHKAADRGFTVEMTGCGGAAPLISTLQEPVERDGGARLCQLCETAKNEGRASLKMMKWTETDAGTAASAAALCTNCPEWANSWHSGQFEGSSLIGYRSRGVAALVVASGDENAPMLLATVTIDIVWTTPEPWRMW